MKIGSRFFGTSGNSSRDIRIRNTEIEGIFIKDIFREFDDLHREMARMYNTFDDVSTNPPQKELVREYQTPKADKIREVGPIVYDYSMTIGLDGKPHVREFGNVKSPGSSV
jgi:HSP20 family protein